MFYKLISQGFSTSASAATGNNTVTFNTLGEGTYASKTVTVTDASGNASSLTLTTFVVDTTAPSLTAVTQVVTPSNDTTPSYVFTTNEAGTITTNISQGFSTSSSAATGNNTVTFNTLGEGTYESKTVTVTDASGNASSLTLTTFDIDTTAPTGAITYSAASPYKQGATATVTATFTEALTTTPKIAISGVSTVAATNMSGSGTTWTYAYTAPAGNGTDTFAFSVGTDAYGNVVTAAPTSGATVTVDNTAPTVSAVTEVVTPSNDSTPNYVFTTNEAGTITTNISEGFSTNASAANGNNTVTFNTLAEGKYESKTVTVTDAAGNASSLTLTTFDIDTTAPTMTITATEVSDGDTSNDTTIALTFTSSQATSNFIAGDITVAGGSLGSLTAVSTTVYTATFTPSSDGATTINVAGGAFTDLAGNNNTAATEFNWTYEYDSAAPTMTITAAEVTDGGTSNDGKIVLTFTSSQATTNFAEADITVIGGALSAFNATSSTVYAATFTPSAHGITSPIATTIDVAANTFTDAVGNNNTAAYQFNWTYDGTAPTMTITAAEVTDGETSNDATIALTLTSSESTTNFDVNDITVTNGTLSSFTGSGTAYTATFTPSAEGATTINVAVGAFTDLVGNNNDAATQFTWTYEATSTPTLGTPWTVALGGNDDVEAVLVSGNYAYVSKHEAGITMVDISDPTNPFVVSTFSYGNTNGHMYIYTVGNNEYLITNNWVSGINVFNVTDKSNITWYTSFSLSSYDGGRVTDLAINGTTLYASIRKEGLVSIDLSNLESTGISVLGHEDLGGDDGDASRGVAIKGNYAIVAKEGAGVAIIDISNPANLGSPSYVSTTGSAKRDIVVSGNYAYVANDNAGVAIIDITTPSSPGTPVYTPGSFTETYGIAINGNYLIISDKTDGTLGIIDISYPRNPGSASYVNSGSSKLRRVASSGNYVYFAADKNLGISLISN